MDYGLYLSTAGASMQDARVDSITNNLANVNTPGFQRLVQTFMERPVESKEDGGGFPFDEEPLLDKIGGGVFFDKTFVDRHSGPVEQTGRSLDVAIKGPGYFGVLKDGERFYTRSGNFVVDKDGRLLTASGFAVLDRDGSAITLDNPDTDSFANRLMLRDFPKTAEVDKRAGNLLQFQGEGTALANDGRILQSHLERSPVSPVVELINLIKAHRSYEANTKMITSQDEALAGIVNLPRPR